MFFGKFYGSQVICHEVIWHGLEDWIEIPVGSWEITKHDIDVGAAQMSQKVFRIDLERLVEETHRSSRIPRNWAMSPFT